MSKPPNPKRRKGIVKRRQQFNRANQEIRAILEQNFDQDAEDHASNQQSDSEADDGEAGGLQIDSIDADDEASLLEDSTNPPADFTGFQDEAELVADVGEGDEGGDGFDWPSDASAQDSEDGGDVENGHNDELHDRPIGEFLFNDGHLDAKTELRQFLAGWATSQGISGVAVDVLLKGLLSLQHQGDAFTSTLSSSSDYRTLLQTPRNVDLHQMEDGGKYYHFGLENGIQDRLALMEPHLIPSEVQVIVNNDGIPLSKSSRSELWACCGLLRGQQQPFPIALHHSEGKPACPNEFLTQTVEETNKLRREGIIHRGRRLAVKIVAFCNDGPARSFVCGICGHTGYYSCPKCRTRGRHFIEPGRRGGRVVYPDMDAALRSHELFADLENPEHHKKRTVLQDLIGIDMVKDFPHDYMHLVCLGVMRKLLRHWVARSAFNDIITQANVDEISKRLVELRNVIPSEFSRHPRSLVDLCRWKATELRQFLLYTGPVVLKGLLPDRLYNHFLCLHVAIKILVSEQFCFQFNAYAKQLLRHFVKESEKLYGGHFISYNVHGLIHLADDVLRYGPLDSFSCFPFENYLQSLKRLVRRSLNPLVQIVKRTIELARSARRQPPSDASDDVMLSHRHSKGPLLSGSLIHVTQFQVVKLKQWRLSVKAPNNIVIMNDGSIVKILNFVSYDGSVDIIGVKFEDPSCLLNPPFNVNGLLNCKSVCSQNVSHLMSWSIDFIHKKAFAIPYTETDKYDEDFVVENYAIFPLSMEDKFR